MSDVAIRVEGLTKTYRIGAPEARREGWAGAIGDRLAAPFEYLRSMRRPPTEAETLHALRDVSFEVRAGEVLGIIGRNGAGKSTLLKILSRITEPTSGRAELHGRVGSLLEVGTGFHPELTGRENIYLNGAILGMRRAEIDRKFDEIVEFSGVERFLDTPVKRYSSGMYVRLAFAVAAHLEPEILLVDEVLAVGDAEFQRKCIGRMGEVSREGRTILLVTHNLDVLLNISTLAVVVESGRIVGPIEPRKAVDRYMRSKSVDPSMSAAELPRSLSNTPFPIVVDFKILTPSEGRSLPCGGPLEVELELREVERYSSVMVSMAAVTGDGRRIVMFHSRYNSGLDLRGDGGLRLRCEVPSLPLAPGDYSLEIGVADQYAGMLERIDSIAVLNVYPSDFLKSGYLPVRGQGDVVLPAVWTCLDSNFPR